MIRIISVGTDQFKRSVQGVELMNPALLDDGQGVIRWAMKLQVSEANSKSWKAWL